MDYGIGAFGGQTDIQGRVREDECSTSFENRKYVLPVRIGKKKTKEFDESLGVQSSV